MSLSKVTLVCVVLCGSSACSKDAPTPGPVPYGPYFWDSKNWSAEDSTSVGLNTTSFFGRPIEFTAFDSSSNPMTISVPSGGYYIEPNYELTFTNVGGVYTLTSVALNADDVALMAGAGIDLVDGPNILMADSENQTFEFQYTLKYGVWSGYSYKYVVDKYYR